MKKLVYIMVILLTMSLLTACGSGFEPQSFTGPIPADDLVVKGQYVILISVGRESETIAFIRNLFMPQALAANGTVPVSVNVASNTQFTLNSAGFTVPAVTTVDTLAFGNLVISALRDNNLSVCGVGGTTKCTQAVLRVYTTGAAGAGLYSVSLGYGAPLTAKLGAGAAQTVGLNVANAAVMQTLAIPANKNVVHLSDFAASPSYSMSGDFSNAGFGIYQSSIVVEYGLQ